MIENPQMINRKENQMISLPKDNLMNIISNKLSNLEIKKEWNNQK